MKGTCMYRMLIVDDEKWEREGLCGFLDWHLLGIEVAGCARNGAEALCMSNDIRPQIVLTDILMPVMDGIEMSRALHQRYPDARIILLSGHDDFQYAKDAFSFHAFEYLLKPVEKPALEGAILRVVASLQEEDRWRAEQESLKGHWMSCADARRRTLLMDFLENKGQLPDMDNGQSALPAYAGAESFIAVLSFQSVRDAQETNSPRTDDVSHAKQIASGSDAAMLLDRLGRFIEHSGGIIGLSPGLDEAVVWLDAASWVKNRDPAWKRLQEEIRDQLDLESILAVGTVFIDLSEAQASYSHARRAMGTLFLADAGEILYGTPIESKCHEQVPAGIPAPDAGEVASRIIHLFRSGHPEEAEAKLEAFLVSLRRDEGMAQLLFQSFLSVLMKMLGAGGHENGNTPCLQAVSSVAFLSANLKEFRSRGQTRLQLVRSLSGLLEPSCRKTEEAESVIRDIRNLISEHYAQGIDLKEISGHVHLSPYYIGELFRKHEGVGFTRYLNDFRLDKARQILAATNQQVARIARCVGISNRSYFCRLFKDTFGLSPGEFRNAMKGNRAGV